MANHRIVTKNLQIALTKRGKIWIARNLFLTITFITIFSDRSAKVFLRTFAIPLTLIKPINPSIKIDEVTKVVAFMLNNPFKTKERIKNF